MRGSKGIRVTGWVLSILIAVFLIVASAVPKFIEWEDKEEMFGKFGYTIPLMEKIGIVEIAVAVLFIIPRTSFVGAILLTGYLGGATATHVRIGDPFYFPIVMGVLAWIALGCRMPTIFTLAKGKVPSSAAPLSPE